MSTGLIANLWPVHRLLKMETVVEKITLNQASNGLTCPYEYILSLYGKNHFENFIRCLDPTLEARDPGWFALILEIMDAIHFSAILVDDVADDSRLRKGQPPAHKIYGSAETINRAYLRIFQVIGRCSEVKPSVIPFILDNLTQIHQGQDDSLVWRRDGFDMTQNRQEALEKYQKCASDKTGALFRLVGQLVAGDHRNDENMSKFGWYCQLQNDCKNVSSSDMIAAKGALAEDLTNGEYSFPILVALYSSPPISNAVNQALVLCKKKGPKYEDHVSGTALMLQRDEVRSYCLKKLAALKAENEEFAACWGRKEKMEVAKEDELTLGNQDEGSRFGVLTTLAR